MRRVFSCRRLAAAVCAVLLAVRAEAHHGKDFLIVETAELPHVRQVYFFSTQDYEREDAEARFELSPALLAGLSRLAAVEVHGHFDKEPDRDMRYEATAASLRVLLTPEPGRWAFGLGGEYEVGRGEAADRFEARLLGAYRRGDASFNANLLVEHERGAEGETEVGYAVGFRPHLEKRLGWGLEGQGGLGGGRGHEVLLGLYAAPAERLTIKVGVGIGFGAGPRWTVRTGLVLRL